MYSALKVPKGLQGARGASSAVLQVVEGARKAVADVNVFPSACLLRFGWLLWALRGVCKVFKKV